MTRQRWPIALLLLLGLLVSVTGCPGTGGDDETTTTVSVPADGDASGGDEGASGGGDSAAGNGTTPPATVAVDLLSTFASKDPFVSKAPTTTTEDENGDGNGATRTTEDENGDGNGATTTTSSGYGNGSGTTTTTQPSGIDNHLHSLRVLSINVINGIPVVTFEVDDTVYEDREEGDVVSTSWGQIKVVSIDEETQTVAFLHGSELRTLQEGQEYLK